MQHVSPLVRVMAITALFIGAVCVPAANVQASSSSNSLAEGLVSYWPLDEAVGAREDAHGATTLSDINGVSSVVGKIGSAAALDSVTNQRLASLTGGNIGAGKMSWAAWMKTSAPVSFGQSACMASVFDSNTHTSYDLCLDNSTGTQRYMPQRALPGVTSHQIYYSFAAAPGSWYYLAMTYDGAVLTGYVNGMPVGSTTASGIGLIGGFDNVSLGARAWAEDRHYSGAIDEVGLWNRALTPEEVARLYNEGRGLAYEELAAEPETIVDDPTLPSGLVSYWPLDELDNTRRDAMAENDLVQNTPVAAVDGKLGSAVHMKKDGSEYLSIADGDAVGLEPQWLSVAAWVRANADSANAVDEMIVLKGAGGGDYRLSLENGGQWCFYIDNTPLCSAPRAGTEVIEEHQNGDDGAWHHIVGTYGGGTARLYVDGALSVVSEFGVLLVGNDAPFVLGQHGPGGALRLEGLIDEVGLWNRALTAEEVARLYNGGKGLPYSDFGSTIDPEPEFATSSVAFLPGIMGSRLYTRTSEGEEERLWERIEDGPIAALALTEEGVSISKSIYAKGIVDKIRPLTGLASLITAGDGYKDWITFMDDMVEQGELPAWKALAYDWRLATDELYRYGAERSSGGVNYAEVPATGMPYLVAQLEALAAKAPSGKVTIVAHSNGGLVAKNILRHLEDTDSPLLKKIDTVVLVGSPQEGTPKAIRELLHGIDMPGQQTVRKTLQNMPGAYGLLPSAELLAELPASEPVVEVDESVSALSFMNDLAGDSLRTYEELASFLKGDTGTRSTMHTLGYLHPNLLNGTLLDRARDMHAAADVWTAPEGIKVIEIVGTGLWTPRGVHYSAVKERAKSGIELTKLRTEWRANMSGDGTVLARAAASGEADRTYYVDLSGYNKHEKKAFAHGTILSVPPVQELIRALTQSDSPVTPLYANTMGAHSSFPRAEMSAYSPVDLHLYADGKHTGVLSSTTTDLGRPFEAEVPNSHYEEWADVKYLGVMLGNGATEVTLDGTGWGTFTLACDLYDGEDARRGAYTFADVPVGPQSTGRVVLTEDAAPMLAYDMNGDGKVDMTVTAQPSGTELTSADLMARLRMYVRTAGFSRWLTEWIDGRLEVAEKLILKRSKGNMTAAKVILRSIAFTLVRQTPQHIPEEKADVLKGLLAELINRL